MACYWNEAFALMKSMSQQQHVPGSLDVPDDVFKQLQWFFQPFLETEKVAKFILEGVDLNDEVLIDFGRDLARHDLAHMPAQLCYFESFNPETRSVVATFALDASSMVREARIEEREKMLRSLRSLDLDEAIQAIIKMKKVEDDHVVWLAVLELKDRGDDGCRLFGPTPTFLSSKGSELTNSRAPLDKDVAIEALDMIVGPLSVLAMKTVTRSTVAPSQRINKKRVARGDDPLPTYEIIKLSYEQIEYERSERGMRASPRPHFRRGHIRTLSTGKMVPVAPTYVIGEAPIKTYRK